MKFLASLPAQKNHKERYWLIIVLFFTNVAYLATMLVNIGLGESGGDFAFITIIYSLVLVYLGGTSLFRIYPQAVRIVEFTREKPKLSIYETSIAEQIEDLVYVQKVHHEPTYSRADMARECEAPEAVISRVVSQHFGQSFPQLLNQRRVEDAKHLLLDTHEAMTVIAREAGFNSLHPLTACLKNLQVYRPVNIVRKANSYSSFQRKLNLSCSFAGRKEEGLTIPSLQAHAMRVAIQCLRTQGWIVSSLCSSQ